MIEETRETLEILGTTLTRSGVAVQSGLRLQCLRLLGKMDPQEMNHTITLRATGEGTARALELLRFIRQSLRMPAFHVGLQGLLKEESLGAVCASVRESTFMLAQMIMHCVLLRRHFVAVRTDEVAIGVLRVSVRHSCRAEAAEVGVEGRRLQIFVKPHLTFCS